MTIDVSALSFNDTSIVLIYYKNFTGNFSDIQIINGPKPMGCQRFIATPKYDRDRFSVLLSTEMTSGCKRKKSSHLPAIIGGVVGGIVLLTVIIIVVVILFCKDSSFFQRKVRTRKESMTRLEISG